MPCNIWQGRFPEENTLADGWIGTSPVKAFPPNGAGLFDMAGNVWEWTVEPFRIRSASRFATQRNEASRTLGQKLMKGGSFLCHISYCYRYRIAARLALVADSGACNSGLRVFYDG
jgi:formylglycine-generating enzyme required for sulfatase activity